MAGETEKEMAVQWALVQAPTMAALSGYLSAPALAMARARRMESQKVKLLASSLWWGLEYGTGPAMVTGTAAALAMKTQLGHSLELRSGTASELKMAL